MDKIKSLGISVNDLITMLRIKGCSLHEAAFVHLETSGDCSVVKKDEGKVYYFSRKWRNYRRWT